MGNQLTFHQKISPRVCGRFTKKLFVNSLTMYGLTGFLALFEGDFGGALPSPAGDFWAGRAGGGGRFWGMGGMRGWRGRLSYGWEREADHQGGGIVRLHGIIPAMRGVWLRRQWRPGGKDHPHGAGSRQRPGR